jgi:isochorismate synthase
MKEQTTTKVGTSDLTEAGFIKQLYAAAKESGYCFALWRLPNDPYTQVILSFNCETFDLQTSFEELPSGFLFHPFDNQKQGAFLKAELMFRFADGKLKEDESPLFSNSITWFNENVKGKQFSSASVKPSNTEEIPPSKEQQEFKALINVCLEHIHRGDFEKVVPSRYKAVPLPENFDSIEAFQKLSTAYPNALISFLHTPQYGAWLGATPEVLVSITDKTTFKTVALAGTQSYLPGLKLRNVAWTQKEIEEQALVGRYIINCFKKIRLREFEEHGPKTIVAGNLMHLKTDFSVDMKATNFPLLGSVMLRLLHPTSAVCGMPMESASAFLLQQEGYDRSFYSGFLGPVNFQDSSHLFVNLRCMQINGDKAICYAGAGVTADSIPEQEWEETEIKLNTLLQVVL